MRKRSANVASATRFCLCESVAAAATGFYLRECEATAATTRCWSLSRCHRMWRS
ncbi:hypothetical protein [Lysinibacillus xylanilyticus]|uniref:hypothetical protein n=1 Tax=Lysinibacillus xylanilyticus TaxID=582475 RepID=UPI001586EC59|nr:hypothetical protein [Lysinibacillus xylanilyticus]